MEGEQSEKRTGPWTEQEHQMFMEGYNIIYEGVKNYGKDWTKIVPYVPTRTGTQIRSHAQKFFNKLEYTFESRAILGDQSEHIMGPPPNEGQYALYKQVGNVFQKHAQLQKVFHAGLFLFCYLIQQAKEEDQNKTWIATNLQKNESLKSQEIEFVTIKIQAQQTKLFTSEELDRHSKIQQIEVNLAFSINISSDENQFSFEQSVKNFMKLYVDYKPISPRKNSQMSVQYSVTGIHQHQNNNNSSQPEDLHLKMRNIVNQIEAGYPSHSQ